MIPWRLRTELGLTYLSYGFIVTICAFFIMAVLVVASFSTISTGDVDSEVVRGSIFGWTPFEWYIIGMYIAHLVMIVSLIFYVPGLWFLNKGKWEFGPVHLSYVPKGIIFVVIGAIIGLFGNFNTFIIFPFFSVISAILVSIGLMIIAVTLSDNYGKNLLRVATIAFILFGIVVAVVNLFFLFFILPPSDMDNIGSAVNGELIPTMVTVFYILPLSLFFYAYRKAIYRIRSGQVLPMVPLPPGVLFHGMVPPIQEPIYPIQDSEPVIGLKTIDGDPEEDIDN